MSENEVASRTFRALVESADRKFVRVLDVSAYGRAQNQHYFQKVFKAYMLLWKYQQENRAKLVEAGLNRWEIGEIASRIGQLYFGQYLRTSESRFLVEAYVFYEAILNRRYFEGSKGSGKVVGVRFKELRFYARFLLVSVILNRLEMVNLLVERFKALVDDSKTSFQDTNFEEWKQVVQEIMRFMKVDMAFMNVRPLRYCATLDLHPGSHPYVARFHAKKVKFAEFTLDTYRMLQCLEWEPSGSFYQERSVEARENGNLSDHSTTSGIINMNLAADMTDPTLPPNPKKAILFRPAVTHLIAVMATICEELPPDSIMLVYLSASGKFGCSSVCHTELRGSQTLSKNKAVSLHEHSSSVPQSSIIKEGDSGGYYDKYLWFGPRGNRGENNLYPGDIIPFTRRPLFLIVDSDNSHAFKVLHGAERGEAAALLLSPLRPAYKHTSDIDVTQKGSQFTLFLTEPLSAFCQLVGLSSSDGEADINNEAENIVSTVFYEWEVILCTSKDLDLAWAQVLSDPFLLRLILRFIFCRSALAFFCSPEDKDQYLPTCLPSLPNSLCPDSEVMLSAIMRLADHFRVTEYFHFGDT